MSGRSHAGKRRHHAAFTLAEVLAAMLLMALVIPVAMRGLQIANRAGVVAERKSLAVHLADRLLNESIVHNTWSNSGQSGTVRQHQQEFRWRLRNDSWIESGLRLVSVQVTYVVQNREYEVWLSTLVKEVS